MKHRTSVGPKTVDPAEKMPIFSFTMATIEMIAVEAIGANAMLRRDAEGQIPKQKIARYI